MTLLEKAAYIKGLADGRGVVGEKIEDKITLALIDLVGDMAREIDSLQTYTRGVNDAVEDLADNLKLIENVIGDADFDDDDDEDEDDEGCDCDDCEGCCDDELEYETACPKCGAEITIDEDDLIVGTAVCPKCGEKWEFEFTEADEEDEDGGGD